MSLNEINDLTKREKEVLELVAEGLTNQAIGEILSITNRAVEKNIHRLIIKILGFIDYKRDHPRVLLTVAWMEYKNE